MSESVLTHPMLARKELVCPGGERGWSESSYMGGGMAAFEPLPGRPSSSYGYADEPCESGQENLNDARGHHFSLEGPHRLHTSEPDV